MGKFRKGEIEKILKRWESHIPSSILKEMADYIESEFVVRIKIEIIEQSDLLVKFLCNLSPEEMIEREKEVCLFLPKTNLGDGFQYMVKLKPYPEKFYCDKYLKKIDEERMPRPAPNRTGWWIYYGEP